MPRRLLSAIVASWPVVSVVVSFLLTACYHDRLKLTEILGQTRNEHIAVEEEVPDPGADISMDDAAAHDRARKAAHDT